MTNFNKNKNQDRIQVNYYSFNFLTQLKSLLDAKKEPVIVKKFISENLNLKRSRTDELYRRFLDDYEQSKLFSRNISEENSGNVKYLENDTDVSQIEQSIEKDKPDNSESLEYDTKNNTLSYKNTQIRTIPELYEAANIDPDKWHCFKHILNKWPVYEGGEPIDGFQIKLWLERKIERVDKEFLENWTPKHYAPKATPLAFDPTQESYSMLVGLSDVHFGLYTDGDFTYRSEEDWSIQNTVDAVRGYAEEIIKDILDKKSQLSELTVVSLGDILHSLTGKTHRGTEIEAHPIGRKQFQIAYESLVEFFLILEPYAPKIKVISMAGNHSADDSTLFMMLQTFFRTNKKFDFEIVDSRYKLFKIRSCAFLVEHGADWYVDKKIPKDGSAREAYIRSLFLVKPEELVGVKQKFFLTGDQHHIEYKESHDYEHIMFSTVSKNDKYADRSNLGSIARQSYLTINDDGMKNLSHYYV